jgi:hypothetical protein
MDVIVRRQWMDLSLSTQSTKRAGESYAAGIGFKFGPTWSGNGALFFAA